MREGWVYKKLGEVCAPKKDIQRANKCFSKDDEIQYIDISSLDNSIQKITGTSLYKFEDAPSRAQQCVKKGDILVSLVRPNLKNIAIVDSCSNNLVASSGFCVLRESLMIDKSYLFYFINSDKTTNYLCSLTAGANYPAIREEDIRGCIIGVPPLTTQQQIVSELDLLSHILDQKRQQLKEYDALAESIFYDMFGDPVENPKGWEVKKLESLVSINSKLVDPKIAPYCEMYHVGPANIISGTGEIVDVKKAKEETLISGKYIFEEGMILYSKIRPALNKVALANMHGLCSADMYPLSPNIEIVNAFFLKYVLSGPAFLKYAIEQSGRARMPKINREALFAFEFPLPPLSLQRSFAAKIESIEHQKQLLRASIKETEMLFQSRMDYWFNS